MVSNQEDFTTPIEDISAKHKTQRQFLQQRVTYRNLVIHSLQCESSGQKLPAKVGKTELNLSFR
jgi:hypothetical protein